MIVGGYELHLYCDIQLNDDHPYSGDCSNYNNVRMNETQFEFSGSTASDANKEARARGWHFISTENIAICPGCWENGFRFTNIREGLE